MLRRSAQRFSDKTAVVDGERRVSYAELLLRAETQAAAFLAAAFHPASASCSNSAMAWT